jgi:hypothetical protein
MSSLLKSLLGAYPVAGAQYYWSYVVSDPKWAPFASYMYAQAVEPTPSI